MNQNTVPFITKDTSQEKVNQMRSQMEQPFTTKDTPPKKKLYLILKYLYNPDENKEFDMSLKLPEYVYDKHVRSCPKERKNYEYFINNLILFPREEESYIEREGKKLYIESNKGIGEIIKNIRGENKTSKKKRKDTNNKNEDEEIENIEGDIKLIQTQLITSQYKVKVFYCSINDESKYKYILKGPFLKENELSSQLLSDCIKRKLLKNDDCYSSKKVRYESNIYYLSSNLIPIDENKVIQNTTIRTIENFSIDIECDEQILQKLNETTNNHKQETENKEIKQFQKFGEVSKSNNENNIFDVFLFASRDIEEIIIPSFIKKISSYSFTACMKLKRIEFQEKSELESIEENAFGATQIDRISIPSNTEKIGKFAFYECKKLKVIEFQPDSKLSLIEENAFSGSSITSISVPSNVKFIQKGTFSDCNELCTVEFLGSEVIFEHFIDSQTNFIKIFSFPNAHKIVNIQFIIPINSSVFVLSGAEII